MIEKGELTVVKANQFVQEYKVSLSLSEIRIVNYLIANIDSPKYDKDFQKFKLDIKEFASIIYPDKKPGEVYKWLPKVIKDLSDKSAWKEVDDEEKPGKKKKVLLRWIERPEFHEGYVTLELNPYLAPYLLQLDKAFFKSKFQYTALAQSKYTIPLYELLKSWEKTRNGEKTFEVEELRSYMDATKKSQQNIAEFKRTALDVAIKEINEITDLLVSYEEIKRGRKVTHIKFKIMHKDQLSEPHADSEGEEATFEATGLKAIFGHHAIDDSKMQDLYLKVEEALQTVLENRSSEEADELIQNCLKEFVQRAEAYGADNLYAYIKSMIAKEDWDARIKRIETSDKATSDQTAAQAAADRDEAELDARNEEWKKHKMEELGVDSWDEAFAILEEQRKEQLKKIGLDI